MPEHRTCEHCGGCGYFAVEWWVNENTQGDNEWRGPYVTRAEAEAKVAEDAELNRRFHIIATVVERLIRISHNTPSPGALRR